MDAVPVDAPITDQPQTTARYAHLDDDALREATDSFGSSVDAAAKGREAEVVPLRDEQ